MKYLICLLLFIGCNKKQQDHSDVEFRIYSNGLMYDQRTMAKLATIVDSLNLKFRVCDLDHDYSSFPQGLATYVTLSDDKARTAIANDISLKEFAARFRKSVEDSNIWIYKARFTDYDDIKRIEYSGLPHGYSGGASIEVIDKAANDKTHGWIVDTNGRSAFYIESLGTQTLPAEYSRLIQYVDCMVDPNTRIHPRVPPLKMYTNDEMAQLTQADTTSNTHRFIEWAEDFPGKPDYPNTENLSYEQYSGVMNDYGTKYNKWDVSRMEALDQKMKTSKYGNNLLVAAVRESIQSGRSNEDLEAYAERYYSKEKTLQLMRSRPVMGRCSQDQSPRIHAMKICQLAAETTHWDIFLRAHLDIMNDRFDRQSDGDYAWASRKTYLKELEELDIEATNLLIGSLLRSSSVTPGHYYGSVRRIGIALSEASDKERVERLLLDMMADDRLDNFNRILLAYAFGNYIESLKDRDGKARARKKLNDAISHLPVYIQTILAKE